MPRKVAIKVIRGVTPTESNKAALFKVTVMFMLSSQLIDLRAASGPRSKSVAHTRTSECA